MTSTTITTAAAASSSYSCGSNPLSVLDRLSATVATAMIVSSSAVLSANRGRMVGMRRVRMMMLMVLLLLLLLMLVGGCCCGRGGRCGNGVPGMGMMGVTVLLLLLLMLGLLLLLLLL